MTRVLYDDDMYKLVYTDDGMYLLINGVRYELSSYPRELCTCIRTKDGLVYTVIPDAFDLPFLKRDFENNSLTDGGSVYGLISALEFCEIIHAFVLKDRAEKKRFLSGVCGKLDTRIVRRLVNYCKGYFIYNETYGITGKKGCYVAIRYDEDGGVLCGLREDSLHVLKERICEHIRLIGDKDN